MSGPFGNYTGRCIGTILNAMSRDENIPLHYCESVTVGLNEIKLGRLTFGEYRWLGDTDKPIFEWQTAIYNQHSKIITHSGLKPKLRIQLYQRNPALVLRGENFVTKSLYDFIKSDTFKNSEAYVNSKPLLAYFSLGELMVIYFNDLNNAQQLVDYINNNFMYSFEDDGIQMDTLKAISKELTTQEKISLGPVYFTCPVCGGHEFSTTRAIDDGERVGNCKTITYHQFCDYTWERNKENDAKLFTRLTKDEWMALYDESIKGE